MRLEKTVLFLCTGNYYRSRFAEVLFSFVAERMGLPWKSSSRGLALERGVTNVGPMAEAAIKALEARGLRASADFTRFPMQVTVDVVRLGRETKGRRGKGVTTVSDLPLDHAGLLEVAAKLKHRCGTGGTVKEGRIEIQGDQPAYAIAPYYPAVWTNPLAPDFPQSSRPPANGACGRLPVTCGLRLDRQQACGSSRALSASHGY